MISRKKQHACNCLTHTTATFCLGPMLLVDILAECRLVRHTFISSVIYGCRSSWLSPCRYGRWELDLDFWRFHVLKAVKFYSQLTDSVQQRRLHRLMYPWKFSFWMETLVKYLFLIDFFTDLLLCRLISSICIECWKSVFNFQIIYLLYTYCSLMCSTDATNCSAFENEEVKNCESFILYKTQADTKWYSTLNSFN